MFFYQLSVFLTKRNLTVHPDDNIIQNCDQIFHNLSNVVFKTNDWQFIPWVGRVCHDYDWCRTLKVWCSPCTFSLWYSPFDFAILSCLISLLHRKPKIYLLGGRWQTFLWEYRLAGLAINFFIAVVKIKTAEFKLPSISTQNSQVSIPNLVCLGQNQNWFTHIKYFCQEVYRVLFRIKLTWQQKYKDH